MLRTSIFKLRVDLSIGAIATIGTLFGAYYTYKSYGVSLESLDAQRHASNTDGIPTDSASLPKTISQDPRARFNSGAIRAAGKEAVIGGQAWYTASIAFTLENLSGMGIEAAIRSGETSIGACIGGEHQSSGLALYDARVMPYRQQLVSTQEGFESVARYIAPNGKIPVTILVSGCQPSNFAGLQMTDAAISLVVRADNNTFSVPLSLSNVPVRMGAFH